MSSQPRIRNRFQTDQHGLARTVGRLVGGGEQLEFDFDGYGSPLQMTLAATYAAGQLPLAVRPRAFDVLRKGLRWRGEIGPQLITHLSGRHGATALAGRGVPRSDAVGARTARAAGRRQPAKKEIQRRFRQLLRDAHPDHGADSAVAAQRIAELTEARRILLG